MQNNNYHNTEENEAQEFIKLLRTQLKELSSTNKKLAEKINELEANAQATQAEQPTPLTPSVPPANSPMFDSEDSNSSQKSKKVTIVLSVLVACLTIAIIAMGISSNEAVEGNKKFITTYLDNSQLWNKDIMRKIDPKLGKLWDYLNEGKFNEVLEMHRNNPELRRSSKLGDICSTISRYKHSAYIYRYCNGNDRDIRVSNYIKTIKGEEKMTLQPEHRGQTQSLEYADY